MNIEEKGTKWELCLKNDLFNGLNESLLPKIQEIFEDILNTNEKLDDTIFLTLIKEKIKQLSNFDYQNTIIEDPKKNINFSDENEVPIEDIQCLLESKQNERKMLFNDLSNTSVENKNENKNENKILYVLSQQNLILEKILLSQINVLELLQKK